jgi:hypothetical protein
MARVCSVSSEGRMIDVRYVEHWPDTPRAIVEPLVASSLWVLPPWIWEVWVYYRSDLDCPAEMTTHDDYGLAKLAIGPTFLDLDDDHRGVVVRHEFLVQNADDCADIVKAKNEELGDQMKRGLTRDMERVTSALEWLLTRRLEAER